MDILNSGRLWWTINNASLADTDVSFDRHPVSPADLDLFDQPIHLQTQNLVLHLRPIKYSYRDDRIEFATGPIVTPLQILGAIYTYYSIPLTTEELDTLEQEYETRKATIDEAREEIHRGKRVPRSIILGENTFLEGLHKNRDGSFVVSLGS